MKKHILFLLFLFKLSLTFSQKENALWHFGDSGVVNFNYTPPVTSAQYHEKFAKTLGAASISSSDGKLLFYSNGFAIYDSTHSMMPNGNGAPTTDIHSPSALILPLPGSSSIYYLITCEANGSGNMNRLYYSVIDMRLNNGKGDVVKGKRNIHLMWWPCQMLTAAKHSNGKDYWVVTHQCTTDTAGTTPSDAIYAWQLSAKGIINNPVISHTGVFVSWLLTNTWKGMKISPDGKKIAYNNYGSSFTSIADFDNSIGKVSNLLKIDYVSKVRLLDLEFSSNSNYIYILSNTFNNGPVSINQFNAKASNNTNLIKSRQKIDSGYIAPVPSLRLAMDDKIYIEATPYGYLNVIHSPDSLGTKCGYEKKYLKIKGRYGALPNCIYKYHPKQLINYTRGCANDTTYFTIENSDAIDSVKWLFGDTASGKNNYSTKINNVTHVYKGSGKYTAILITYSFWGTDTFTRQISPIQVNPNFKVNDICELDSARFINLSDTGLLCKWKFGDGSTSNDFSPSHYYSIGGVSKTFNVMLKASRSDGCSDSITKQVTINANPVSDFNYTVNQNKVIFKPAESSNTFYKWWYGNGDSANRSSNEHTYTYENLSKKYNVCMMSTNAANCSSKTCKDINITVGLNTIKNINKIKVYPNPANETIMVEMDGSDKTEFNIQLINSMGQVVIERTAIQHLTFNIQHLSEGVYLLRVISDGKVWSQKVIVSFGGDANR